MDKAESQDKFEVFLTLMDDQLDALRSEAAQRGIELNSSLADLERLEKLFDLMSEGLDKDAKASLVVSFARHLGEVVRLRFGGSWHLPLNDPKDINFNTPVIVGHAPIAGLAFAPLSAMRAYALRKKPGTLRRAVEADIHIRPVDLNGLIEE
jgi:hypothetical protein